MTDQELQLIWAKSAPKGSKEAYHPLLLHMLDTAAVARELWQVAVAPSTRRAVSSTLQLSEEAAGEWLSMLAGLHDLGKCSPAFQQKWKDQWQRLWQWGLPAERYQNLQSHGMVTAAAGLSLLMGLGLPFSLADALVRAVGGHHGVFPFGEDLNEAERQRGQGPWEELRKALFQRYLELAVAGLEPLAAEEVPSWLVVVVAGLACVADWVASDEEAFPHRGCVPDVETYASQSRRRAREVAAKMLWGPSPAFPRAKLETILGPTSAPRPVQVAVHELAQDLRRPSVVVVEAPMGEGKTEAAMALAAAVSRQLGHRGFYFALPTEATSDQLYRRLSSILSRLGKAGELLNLQLLHGHAHLRAELELKAQGKDILPKISPTSTEKDDEQAAVIAAEWFTHRKRGLLSPYGVGTVDQVMLSVLRTRHFFVRLFGLTGKTVILDEVHAYDAYMLRILETMVTWLAALGSTVVLLSATLPSETRRRLVQAYLSTGGGDAIQLPEVPYPRVLWADGEKAGAKYVEPSPASVKRVRLRWITREEGEAELTWRKVAEILRERCERGGRVAVVVNTVAEAQKAYRVLKEAMRNSQVELFHAQFPLGERIQREQWVIDTFGSPYDPASGCRPTVLVATQVIEQSLNLDFDLMISSLTPVDLLFQRAGRLHRFRDRDSLRPPSLSAPELWIVCPKEEDRAFPKGDEQIYHRAILLRSWLCLQDRAELRIPEDAERMVEAVYGLEELNAPSSWAQDLHEAMQALQEKLRDLESQASLRLVPPPDVQLLEHAPADYEEDRPDVSLTLQALTRWCGHSVTAVLLDEKEDMEGFEVSRPDQVRDLLLRSVRISHEGLVHHLLRRGHRPASWERSPYLRDTFALRLVAGQARVGRYWVRLSPEEGLIIS